MHGIMLSVLDLFRILVRGERGWPEVDSTRRLEEQRDHIYTRGYSRCPCTGRPGRRGMRGVFLRSRPRRQYSGQHRPLGRAVQSPGRQARPGPSNQNYRSWSARDDYRGVGRLFRHGGSVSHSAGPRIRLPSSGRDRRESRWKRCS